MEPWDTSAFVFSHVENFVLRTTHCFLSFKKFYKRFSKFPDISFWGNLYIIPSCHTLTNAFDISRKTLLTSSSKSKDSLSHDNSWLIQESSGLKLHWSDEISLFSIKKLNITLKSNLSRNFPQIVNKDTGNFLVLTILVFFLFRRNNASFNALLEYHFYRFVNGRTAYF